MAWLVGVCCLATTGPRGQVAVKLVGHGAVKCDRFTADVDEDVQNIRPYLAWGQGYMSGIIFFAPPGENEKVDIGATHLPVLDQIQFLETYCRDSPKAEFSEAVFALFLKLGGKAR
jgi:hypothetical protein